jgi:hypothetical protein
MIGVVQLFTYDIQYKTFRFGNRSCCRLSQMFPDERGTPLS